MSAIAHRESFLQSVNECAAGELDVVELATQADDSLQSVSLYPPAPLLDLGQAAGQILENSPEPALNAAMQLMASEFPATRALTCTMISRLARYNPSIWAGMVRHLATDDSWEVREYAAHVFDSREGYSGAVEFHQEYVLEELAGWVSGKDYLLQHAATQALLGYVQVNDQIIARLLELLNPLLTNASDYVRTGYVIALRAMGRKQPEVILKYMELQMPPKSDDIRETFRQVLDHPFANKLPDRKQELLAKLNT